MPTVMKIVPYFDKIQFIAETAQGNEPEWKYLKRYDLEAYQGRGRVVCTSKIEEALRFKDLKEAMDTWRARSKTVPFRPDGKPNRPLTAYHATFEEVE